MLRQQAECLTAARQNRLVNEKKRQQKLRSKEKERVKAMVKYSPESVEIAELKADIKEQRELLRHHKKMGEHCHKLVLRLEERVERR